MRYITSLTGTGGNIDKVIQVNLSRRRGVGGVWPMEGVKRHGLGSKDVRKKKGGV